MSKQDRIKLVVVGDHTLGYIMPPLPNEVAILRTRRTTTAQNPYPIGKDTVMRLAGEADFVDFNCHFKGFNNPDKYEYLIKTPELYFTLNAAGTKPVKDKLEVVAQVNAATGKVNHGTIQHPSKTRATLTGYWGWRYFELVEMNNEVTPLPQS